MTTVPPDLVEIGYLSGVFGVRGALKVFSYTRPRENVCDYRHWHLERPDGTWERRRVVEARPHGAKIVATLEGVDDRDAAAPLVGARIAIARSELPPPAEGEFYWADLVGLDVVNAEGIPLGRVRELFEVPANDVLVVEHAGGERLIPFVRGVHVLDVDLAARRLTVNWDPRD